MLSFLVCFLLFFVVWILIDHSDMFVDDAGSSVVVHDDPTSRGPTAAAADATDADSQSSAAPSPAPAAESTHVTPGNASAMLRVHRGPQ